MTRMASFFAFVAVAATIISQPVLANGATTTMANSSSVVEAWKPGSNRFKGCPKGKSLDAKGKCG